eukprot:1703192-Heterocapsa_arctica.AAC.1
MDSCQADLAVPWAPHFGIEIRLSTSTTPIARNVLNSPQTFRSIPAFAQGKQQVSWDECWQLSNTLHKPASFREHLRLISKTNSPHGSIARHSAALGV